MCTNSLKLLNDFIQLNMLDDCMTFIHYIITIIIHALLNKCSYWMYIELLLHCMNFLGSDLPVNLLDGVYMLPQLVHHPVIDGRPVEGLRYCFSGLAPASEPP